MAKQLAWRNGWIVEVEVKESKSPAQSARGKDMVKSGCAQITGRTSGRAQGEKGEG